MPGSTQQSAKYLHTKQKNRKKKTKNTTGVEKENSQGKEEKKRKESIFVFVCKAKTKGKKSNFFGVQCRGKDGYRKNSKRTKEYYDAGAAREERQHKSRFDF